MPSFEVPSPEPPRRVTATELDSTAELAERLDAAELALLLVAAPDLEPALEDVVATVQHALPELTVVRLEPDTVDPSMLWFYVDALPRLRRLRLPENRLLPGFYLFEQGSLRSWHPLTRLAGLWVQQLIAQQARR